MLDVITCEGCGRKTYAQLAHCPQCGQAIDAPESSLNLPPEYTYQDERGVWIYLQKGKRIAFSAFSFMVGCLLLGIGLLILWLQIGGQTLDPRGGAVFVLGPVLGTVLIYQAIQLTWRLISGLPVFYMGKKGVAFPHLNRRVVPWENIKDVDALEYTQRLFVKKRYLRIELYSPDRIAFGPINQLVTFGPRKTTFVPLLAGWPFSTEDIKDLILLGRETWITNGQPAVPSPTDEEEEFNRVVKHSSIIAVTAALALPILLTALSMAG